MNNLQTMTNTGVRKRLYWGFQIEHRNKIENINLTPWFKVRHCCSEKHSNCLLYIDIPLVLWFYFINLPPPSPRKKRPTGHRPLRDRYSFNSLLFLKAKVIPTTVYWNLVPDSFDLFTFVFSVRSVRHTSRSSQSQNHEDEIIGLRVFNYNNY